MQRNCIILEYSISDMRGGIFNVFQSFEQTPFIVVLLKIVSLQSIQELQAFVLIGGMRCQRWTEALSSNTVDKFELAAHQREKRQLTSMHLLVFTDWKLCRREVFWVSWPVGSMSCSLLPLLTCHRDIVTTPGNFHVDDCYIYITI
jgi:hypothetical protein